MKIVVTFSTIIVAITGVLLCIPIEVKARCCIPRPISCYDCISTKNPKCKDPFNRSALPDDHPPTVPCNGCCIKWVQNLRTPKEIVQRTCISQFQVNLFMVDRACMTNKQKNGYFCFCEEDLCNSSPEKYGTLVLNFIASCIFILLIYL